MPPLPPGPRGSFLTGNLPEYVPDQLGFLERCAREYGDVTRLRFLNVPLYLLSHPDHVEYVLVRNNRNFIKDRAERSGLRFLGQGLLTSEGDYWRRQRRLAQPAFHRQRISAYGRTMVESAEGLLDASWRDGATRGIQEDMSRLTLEIVSATLFGASMTEELEEEVGEALEVVMGRFTGGVLFKVPERIPTPANLRFRRAVRRLEEIIYGIIRERRRSPGGDGGDLLSMLLAARDEATGEGMTDRQLRDEVLTVFLAGHETTALNLSWTWHLLAGHPEVEEKLHEELREVLAGRAPETSDLPSLRYADAVIKESTRLYPPVWGFGREALADCEIGGYRVPKGTQVVVSQWVMHRDERYFGEPETFRPERWLDGSTDGLPKYAYFPFGGGPRLCIGSGFAKMEAVLLLATVARRFRLRHASGQESVRPLPSLTLRPDNGLRMVLEERR
ncbi:cytochrome P450 [Rubrobacter marinus]|nr:cytochrome P450 [Rubrobacter marinus]